MMFRNHLLAVGLLGFVTSLAEAQTPPAKDKDGSRPPQVRTYSTVTVVDDPAKAPRLPTQKTDPSASALRPAEPKEALRPTTPAQLREGLPLQQKPEVRDGKPGQPTPPAPSERRNLDALRQDLRATAKEVREANRREPGREVTVPIAPTPHHPPQDPKHPVPPQLDKAPRPLLRERIIRDN